MNAGRVTSLLHGLHSRFPVGIRGPYGKGYPLDDFIGKDILTADAWTERAFISTYQKLGYIQDDKLLVLGPKKEADYFSFVRKDGATAVLKPQADLLMDALGYIQGTNFIYKNRLNRLKN